MSKKVDNFIEVSKIYDEFDESSRLSSKATRVEFLTTVKYIERYLKPGMKILDLGAGTGVYSIYFAEKGYDLVSVELVDKHVDEIKSKVRKNMNIEVYQGDARYLDMLEDNIFDIVLCFGPLYHLREDSDKRKVLDEIKRVAKADGLMYFSFISNDMIIITETILYTDGFLLGNDYDHETFKLEDRPFVFHTVDKARDLLVQNDLDIKREVATDGFSELLSEKINAMDEEDYQQWLSFHLYTCEKPEFLGASNHLLFLAENKVK